MSFIIFGLLCNDDNMSILRKYINVGRFYLQADIRYNFFSGPDCQEGVDWVPTFNLFKGLKRDLGEMFRDPFKRTTALL